MAHLVSFSRTVYIYVCTSCIKKWCVCLASQSVTGFFDLVPYGDGSKHVETYWQPGGRVASIQPHWRDLVGSMGWFRPSSTIPGWTMMNRPSMVNVNYMEIQQPWSVTIPFGIVWIMINYFGSILDPFGTAVSPSVLLTHLSPIRSSREAADDGIGSPTRPRCPVATGGDRRRPAATTWRGGHGNVVAVGWKTGMTYHKMV